MMRLLRFPPGPSESNLPITHRIDNVKGKLGGNGFTSFTSFGGSGFFKSFVDSVRYFFSPKRAGAACAEALREPELSTTAMPSERRNLRSGKDSTSSTNGEKSRADSSKSSSKDKPVPNRTTSSKGKSTVQKRGSKDSGSDKPKLNGAAPVGSTPNGTDDVAMADDGSDSTRPHKEGEDEMTVVVPPPKGTKLSGEAEKDKEGDIKMADGEEDAKEEAPAETVDPKVKTIAGEAVLSAA